MMNVGTEWIVDAEGCAAESLSDAGLVLRLCRQVIADLELKVVGEPMLHQFPEPGGVTALFLLKESHLACHTYPETGTATFNLYCCRERPEWPWEQHLSQKLSAARVTVRVATRGRTEPLSERQVSGESY
jgi:S-adenosylmethionine decarboxylase